MFLCLIGIIVFPYHTNILMYGTSDEWTCKEEGDEVVKEDKTII